MAQVAKKKKQSDEELKKEFLLVYTFVGETAIEWEIFPTLMNFKRETDIHTKR